MSTIEFRIACAVCGMPMHRVGVWALEREAPCRLASCSGSHYECRSAACEEEPGAGMARRSLRAVCVRIELVATKPG